MKPSAKCRRGYTFLELMITVTILSIGIVGIYKVLLAALDYQTQLSCRLYAANLMEHEIALLENQFASSGEFPSEENGKLIEAVLDHRNVPFQFSLVSAAVENNIAGLLPVTVVLSWPDRGHTINTKRDIYLLNLKVKPPADVPSPNL